MTPAPVNKDSCGFDLPPLWIDLKVPESDVDASDSDYEPDDRLYSHHESNSFKEALICAEPVTKRGSDSPTPNMVAYARRTQRPPSPPWPEVTPFDFSVHGYSEWEREEASRDAYELAKLHVRRHMVVHGLNARKDTEEIKNRLLQEELARMNIFSIGSSKRID